MSGKYFVSSDGAGFTQDGTIPDGAIECTQEHFDAKCRLVNGVIEYPHEERMLNDEIELKISQLSGMAKNEITSGFYSMALGEQYFYASSESDQANLTANVLSSLMQGVDSSWHTVNLCCDSNGAWDYQPHSAIQIQQVGQDCKNHILNVIKKLNSLRNEVKNCQSIDDLKNMVWQ